MRYTVTIPGCCAVNLLGALLSAPRFEVMAIDGVHLPNPTAVTIKAGGVLEVEFGAPA